MNGVISIIIFIVSFLVVFIALSMLLYWLNDKYSLFVPIQTYIKNSGKQVIIGRFVSIAAFFLFFFIARKFKLNDYQFGIVLGVCSSLLLAILEPRKKR